MDSTTSVSKGVFLFKNGFKLPKKSKKSRKVIEPDVQPISYSDDLWYAAFKKSWSTIDRQVQKLNQEMYANVLENLIKYVKTPYKSDNIDGITTAALLTGINLPDHGELFKNLQTKIVEEVTPHVVVMPSEKCTNLKLLVQNLVYDTINQWNHDDEFSDSEDDCGVKKTICTFATLEAWYNETYPWTLVESPHKSPRKKRRFKRHRKNIVVIFPDFESLKLPVLQDFILIANSYLHSLPIVLVFGVATSADALHKYLSYKISTKLNIRMFHSKKSVTYLNEILEKIFLTPDSNFYLDGKCFTLLTDVFLFYDFSVRGFIQGLKFAMCDHFYNNSVAALCCNPSELREVLIRFSHQDLEKVRQLPSFKVLTEAQHKNVIEKLSNDIYLKDYLNDYLPSFHSYLFYFQILLRCLFQLTLNLPKSPLGKNYREYYAQAVSKSIVATPEYAECMQLLLFASKEELMEKITNISRVVEDSIVDSRDLETDLQIFVSKVKYFSQKIEMASFEPIGGESQEVEFNSNLSRDELRKKLLEMSKSTKKESEFDVVRRQFLDFMTKVFTKYLKIPKAMPCFEIFFYRDFRALKTHILGSPRVAIHSALNNPQQYLECPCCVLPSPTAIVPTLPDLTIVYKLHLECGVMINMYDWLQAFIAILDPEGINAENGNIDPKLQARFTRAISELQFLGYIKTSKRKTDHVTRLTWGGS